MLFVINGCITLDKYIGLNKKIKTLYFVFYVYKRRKVIKTKRTLHLICVNVQISFGLLDVTVDSELVFVRIVTLKSKHITRKMKEENNRD